MAKNKQTKQFRELSDEELKLVNGGINPESHLAGCFSINVDRCSNGTTLDKFGCLKCI